MELKRKQVELSDLACDTENALEKAREMNSELFAFFDIKESKFVKYEFPHRRTEHWILSDYVIKATELTAERMLCWKQSGRRRGECSFVSC